MIAICNHRKSIKYVDCCELCGDFVLYVELFWEFPILRSHFAIDFQWFKQIPIFQAFIWQNKLKHQCHAVCIVCWTGEDAKQVIVQKIEQVQWTIC